ncbi:MAG: non-heme iron oxygenase ferredoxin subunit [Steroidobacteraceae bacterium]
MPEEDYRAVLLATELPEGAMRAVAIDSREIVLCHSKAGVHALDNICTHALARMNEGRLRGLRLICPLHGASFDVRDGRVLGAPATKPLACHRLRIIDGMIEVALVDPANKEAATE